MTKKTDKWMPLYVGDYLADTMHLNARQHGGYLLLLMHAWVNGGLLPTQDDKLRAIARMSAKEWKDDGADIRSFFVETEDGLRHKRVDIELGRADAIVEQRSAAGKASAEQRKRQRELNDRSTPVENSLQREDQQNGTPSPPQVTELQKQTQQRAESQEERPREVVTPLRAASEPPESPPKSPTRRGEIAALLRGLGVVCTYANPPVVEWAEAGLSDELLREAVSVARMRKPVPEPIPLAYLAPIVAETRRSPAHRKTDWRKVFGPDVTDEEIAELEAKEAASAQA